MHLKRAPARVLQPAAVVKRRASRMRDARMSRRLSQAPRLSLVWTAISIEQNTAATTAAASAEQSNDIMADDGDTSKRGSLRDFCCNHVKSIATTVMMFGMIFCVVMIVMGKLVRYLFTIYNSVFCVAYSQGS